MLDGTESQNQNPCRCSRLYSADLDSAVQREEEGKRQAAMSEAEAEADPSSSSTAVVGTNEDWISHLPDCILHTILLSLSLKEAGATTLLSNRWRYLFHSIPSLIFLDETFTPFVDRNGWIQSALAILASRRHHPLDSCLISVDFFDQFEPQFHAIIHSLCEFGVSELTLLNHHPSKAFYYRIPSRLLACASLNNLGLERCRLTLPPAFPGLGNLRVLWLYDVAVTDAEVEQMVSFCRSLELLSLSYCPEVGNLVIRGARSLSVLEVFTRRTIRISVEKAPVLSSVTVRYRYRPDHYDDEGSPPAGHWDQGSEEESEVAKLVGLLEGLGQVEVLSLAFQLFYPKHFERDWRRMPRSLPPRHHLLQLKQLSVRMDFNNKKLVSVLSCLLHSSPSLQDLVIGGDWLEGYGEMADPDLWDQNIPPDCLAKWPANTTLRAEFVCVEHWIGFAKFLLMNVCSLKKITILHVIPTKGLEYENIRKELGIVPTASPNVLLECMPINLRMGF